MRGVLPATLLLFPCLAFAQVRFRPAVYAGGGLGLALSVEAPAFTVEDQADRNFQEINLAETQHAFTRGQIRVNLLSWRDFSAGALYWGHFENYPRDFPEYWLKEGKRYPYSTHSAAAALTLQWDIGPLRTKRVTPFLLAGAGRWYGNTRAVECEWVDEERTVYAGWVRQSGSASGAALIGGAGVRLFRYAYVYAGGMVLLGSPFPSARFFDAVLGVAL